MTKHASLYRHCGLAVSGLALTLLAACGSKPQGPVEQVVVRKPGAAATGSSASLNGATPADAGTGLIAAGKAAAATCLACHAVAAGAPNRIGPNLYGVVGRKAGALAGVAYSPAMKASGLTWTSAELDAFLTNPADTVPGTTMAYRGVQDAATRKAIIAYLGSISPD